MPKYNLIVLNSDKISLKAKGILETMVNNPEDDYCTDEKLQILFKADTLETIHSALKELIEKGYVLQLDGCTYAVNKQKIMHMQLI